MKKNFQWLIPIVATLLILGILPSFTALSAHLFELFPLLGQYLGPINFLKLGLPVLLVYVLLNSDGIPRKTVLIFLASLFIGTVATFFAAKRCGFPGLFLREWAIILFGAIAGAAWVCLPKKWKILVTSSWVAIVASTVFLHYIFPDSIAWLYANVFDPSTPQTDFAQVGEHVLNGVFSRQSMAKLLAWLPWILLLVLEPMKSWSRPTKLLLWSLPIVTSGFILATSQRAPLLALFFAWMAFGIHQGIRLGHRRVLLFSAGAVMVGLVLTWLIVPQDLLKKRLQFLSNPIKITSQDRIETRDDNSNFRIRMNRLSMDSIRSHPMGDACIPIQVFKNYGVGIESHSHNLFLEQVRSRGWLWGSIHFLLWALACVGAWRIRNRSGSILLASLTVILASGMADHHWNSLSHALLLWPIWILGVGAYFNPAWFNRLSAESPH